MNNIFNANIYVCKNFVM